MTCPHCLRPRTACPAPDACAVCPCPSCRWHAGAEAMRAACVEVVRRWWGRAGRVAGYRWPGHPHHLECEMRALAVGGGTAGGDGGKNPIPAHPQPLGDGGHRPGVDPATLAPAPPKDGPRANGDAAAPRRELLPFQDWAQ